MIRVVVADDHPIVRSGIVGLLGSADDIEVVGEASDGAEAVALATQLSPDEIRRGSHGFAYARPRRR